MLLLLYSLYYLRIRVSYHLFGAVRGYLSCSIRDGEFAVGRVGIFFVGFTGRAVRISYGNVLVLANSCVLRGPVVVRLGYFPHYGSSSFLSFPIHNVNGLAGYGGLFSCVSFRGRRFHL